jgi:CheY-like chemotaxis protein
MLRLLVVEDQVEFYEDYLMRFFEKLLPMETISVVHVPSIDSALTALREPWDVVLMDYTLGPRAEFLGDPVLNGADLVAFRRAIEAKEMVPKAIIFGTSASAVGNRLMVSKGADVGVSKLNVEEMAGRIEGVLKKQRA